MTRKSIQRYAYDLRMPTAYLELTIIQCFKLHVYEGIQKLNFDAYCLI